MQKTIKHTGCTLLLACALGLAGAAQAAVVFENLGFGAPPTHVGGIAVTPFDVVPQAAIVDTTDVSTIPGSPVLGDLTVTPDVEKRTMPGSWNSVWSNGYTGPIFFAPGELSLTLTLPPNTTAFYFHAQPDRFGTYTITATGADGTTSGPVAITTNSSSAESDIPGLAFHVTAPGEFISSITVTVEADAGAFGIAQFGIGTDAPPVPPAPTVTAVPTLGQWSLLLLGLTAAGLGAARLRRRG